MIGRESLRGLRPIFLLILFALLHTEAARSSDFPTFVETGENWFLPSRMLLGYSRGEHADEDYSDEYAGDEYAGEIHLAREPRALLAFWHEDKAGFERDTGISFTLAYSALYQSSSATAAENDAARQALILLYDYLSLVPPAGGLQDEAAGGIFEFSGKWAFVHRGTANEGFIGFDLENRHRIETTLNPQSLFLDNGAFWPTATAFGQFDTALLTLYYKQMMFGGRLGIQVGKYLPFAVYDYFSLKNPKAAFNDLALTVNPAIAWSTWGMGATVFLKPTPETYINAGIHDTNGGPRRGVETFFTEREYFVAVDAGYNTDFSFGKGNIHAMYWHTDARQSAGTPSSYGVTVAAEQDFYNILPFIRYSYQDGQAAAVEHFFAGGVGLKQPFGRAKDVIGIGVAWGVPANRNLFVTNQTSVEAFYRFHLTKELSVSPGITYIRDPPVNLTEDELTLFTVRGRAEF
ncbi:MAG: carbohydrate porin [Hyphomicrobiaceae bacterium]